MNLAPDIGPDDLKVFLDEVDEQLQMLDANIVALENADDQEDLIQEIFRVAHTLKGSSAMLGYQEMTDLGHAVETLLDKVRKGTLEPTTQVVDALLHSLDVLQLLKDALVDESMDVVDVSEVVAVTCPILRYHLLSRFFGQLKPGQDRRRRRWSVSE